MLPRFLRILPGLAVGLAVLALVGVSARPQPASGPEAYDILVRNGRVLDGSGNPWIPADVAIRDGRIAAVGRLADAAAGRVIDAAGRYVTPGFIDVHSHAAEGLGRVGLRQGQPMLAQGVTAVVINPDGGGPVDLEAQRRELERGGVGVNVLPLIGHAAVRREVLGMADRAPTGEELDRMRDLVRRGMDAGAFGLSSGLFYAPGSYATTEEVIVLAEVAAGAGGVYTSHIRDEGTYTVGLLAAVDEVIRIAEEAGLPGIVSHMKALGPDSWGLSVAATTRIERARSRGVQVFADQYPYEASSTSLVGALIPRWAQAGGDEALRARLAAAETRARLLEDVRENIRRRNGAEALVVAQAVADRSLEGRTLAEIAAGRGQPPAEAVLDLVAQGSVSIVSFNMSEQDIEHIMRQPYTMACSDGGLVFPTEGTPHPRNYGAFARRLERYVRERGTVGLEFAVRSMTSLPAQVFGLPDRGVIRPGAWADLAIFDLDEVHEAASYQDPHHLATGMAYVFVNGTVVVDEGRFGSQLPGRVLRRPGAPLEPAPASTPSAQD